MLSTQTNDEIAFLIEGYEGFQTSTTQLLPECSAIKLARMNNCRIFDPITTSGIFYPELFKNKSELEQKMYFAVLAHSFKKSKIPNYEQYLCESAKKGFIDSDITMPKWLKHLNENNFVEFEHEIKHEIAKNHQEYMTKLICDSIVGLSNELSFHKLLIFLKENPNITTVFGLVGNLHLDIVNHLSTVILHQHFDEHHGYAHAQLDIGNRKVEIYLSGGTHGEVDHYQTLLNCVRENSHLTIPADNSKLNYAFTLFAKNSPLIFLQDQKLLVRAKELLDQQYPESFAKKDEELTLYRSNFLETLHKLKGRILNTSQRVEITDWIKEQEEKIDFSKRLMK